MAGSKALRKNVLEKDIAADRYFAGGFEPTMTKKEAMLILNIKSLDDVPTIKNNYKKLLMANHPDKGGSIYLAQKINQAKVVVAEYTKLD